MTTYQVLIPSNPAHGRVSVSIGSSDIDLHTVATATVIVRFDNGTSETLFEHPIVEVDGEQMPVVRYLLENGGDWAGWAS